MDTLCEECMGVHVRREAAVHPASLPRCPVVRFHGRKRCLPESMFHAWLEARRAEDGGVKDEERWSSASVCAHARDLQCPHCDRRFVDFDGCLALRCTCDRWFCALCLMPQKNGDEAHDHVRACSLNPSNEHFLPLETCRRIWLGRARERVCKYLQHVRDSDGSILEFALSRAIANRDPELHDSAITFRVVLGFVYILFAFCMLLSMATHHTRQGAHRGTNADVAVATIQIDSTERVAMDQASIAYVSIS